MIGRRAPAGRPPLADAVVISRVPLIGGNKSAADVTRDVGRALEPALTIADEHRFMRSLLVDGGPLDEVLRGMLRRAPSGSHRDELGQRLRARLPLPTTTDNAGTPFVPSSRELEILRHLATGLSNREIAAELYISLNTMKTHVRSLYRRLGVSSRSHAVAAGRARGLL